MDQAPYFYRFALGEAAGTVVSDGPMNIGAPRDFFLNLDANELEARLRANFLGPDRWDLEQNVLVLKLGGKTILFETGLGPDYRDFQHPNYAKTGMIHQTMAQAGIDPALIDAVVISHAHVDHCGGVIANDGSLNFPNAEIFISQQDFDFFTADPDSTHPNHVYARRHLMPVRDRITFIRHEQEFLPGVTALHAPGHSPGQMLFVVQSGSEQLILTGDLVHDHAALLSRPRAQLILDHDGAQGVVSRVRYLEMIAANEIPILSYHFPWPGIGHVVPEGEGFRFLPRPMVMA